MWRRSMVGLLRAIQALASAFAATAGERMAWHAFESFDPRRVSATWLGILVILEGSAVASAPPCRQIREALANGKTPHQVATELNVSAGEVRACTGFPRGDCRQINDAIATGKSVDELASGMDLPVPWVRNCARVALRELGDWMERSLNEGTGPVVPRVRALFDRVPHTWQASTPNCGLSTMPNLPAIETDLDADGTPELVVAGNIDGDLEWEHDGPRASEWWPESALFIVTQAEDRHRVVLAQDTGNNVSLVAAADLLGDGHREIIWSGFDRGAHTCSVEVAVSAWDGRTLSEIPGYINMASPTGFEIAGRDIIITGGLIASVGAGQAQRNHTDRYRVEADQVRLVDRRYDASDFAYHRLIDGVEAQSWGRTAEALQAFREAADPQRPVLSGEWIAPEAMETLGRAVRAFARFRLAALLLNTDKDAARQALTAEDVTYGGLGQTMIDASDRAIGCTAAAAWAVANLGFLRALNSPFGYANPCWEPQDVCGPLPKDGPHSPGIRRCIR